MMSDCSAVFVWQVKLGWLAILMVMLAACAGPVPAPDVQQAHLPDYPIIGAGGSGNYSPEVKETITSFREWDHYHDPGGKNPDHRFWTFAKMDRYAQFPVGKCMPGIWRDLEAIDKIFECDKPIIADVASRYPGAWYQIGNEPNWYPYIRSDYYAYQFRLYEQYIHALDPTAKLMTGGITLFSADWTDWMGWLLEENLLVDIWVIHPYAYGWPNGEVSAKGTIAEIQSYRAYLDTHGLSDAPILIGEFSDASGNSQVAELAKYAQLTTRWLTLNWEAHNIIGWYWWGVTTLAMGNAGLFGSPYSMDTITPVGKAYLQKYDLYYVYLPIIFRSLGKDER